MESFRLQKLVNELGQITHLTIGGFLVVEQAQQIKKELVDVQKNLSGALCVDILEVDDIDISFVQLMVAFTKKMKESEIKFSLKWNLDEEQQLLFKNVGLSYELNLND